MTSLYSRFFARKSFIIAGAVMAFFCFIPSFNQSEAACRTEYFYLANNQSKGQFTLYNCTDNATAAQINNILSNSDAAYYTFNQNSPMGMKSGDIFVSNNEWIIWISQVNAPGILSGLWGIDRNGNPSPAGWMENTLPGGGARFRSFLQPYPGFGGLSNSAGTGMRALNAEFWKHPGYDSMSYENSGAAPNAINISSTQFSTWTGSRLKGRDGYTYKDPVTQQRHNIWFYATYIVTPSSFELQTKIGSTVENTNTPSVSNWYGHQGGILLLTNRACTAFINCLEYNYGAPQLRDNAFHLVTFLNTGSDGVFRMPNPNCIPQIGTVQWTFDLHPLTCPTFDGSEDRVAGVDLYTSTNPQVILAASRPGVSFRSIPTWPQTREGRKMIASHYNDGRLGLTGFNSLDFVTMAPPGGVITVSNTDAGQLKWTVRLTRTLSDVVPTAVPTVRPPTITPIPTTNPNISPGRATLTPVGPTRVPTATPRPPTTAPTATTRPPTAIPTATPRPATPIPTTTTAPGQPTSTPRPATPTTRPPTAAPTGLPTSIVCQTARGDANCDGAIDSVDFVFWKTKYLGGTIPADIKVDFNGDGKVNLVDLEIWTKNQR